MTLPEFSVNRRITTVMLVLIILLFGMIAFFSLGLDLMPDMQFPMLVIATYYPGVAAEDVENLITKNLEEVVSAVGGVKSVYSASQEGVSSIVAEFEWGTNLDSAAQEVRDKIALVERFLPADAEDPQVIRFDASQMPALVYGAAGLENTIVLKRYLEDSVAPRIERIEGAAAAMTIGGLTREVQVILDQDRLAAEGLSAQEVMAALARENLNVSAGHVSIGRREYIIRTLGEFRTLDDIAGTVVTARTGKPVHVRDLGLVRDTHAEIRSYARLNGKPCVIFAVMKQSGANTVTVVRKVRQVLEDMKSEFPGEIQFAPVFDQADFIERSLGETLRTGIEGGILAVLIIFVFLRSWRPTLTIFMAIPLSIVVTFIGLWAWGYTFNVMTLAGFALGVGMLVDNAVVVIENTFRHLEEGKSRKEAAILGAGEVGLAISASTFTTMAVFLPMIIVPGMASQLARPLALTVCMCLLASLGVALTIVPMLTATLFKSRGKGTIGSEGQGFLAVRGAYERMLGFALDRKLAALGTAFILFVVCLGILAGTGMEMMPVMDSPMSILQVRMPPGTRFEATSHLMGFVEDQERMLPEVVDVISMVGPSEDSGHSAAQGFGAADVNEGMIFTRFLEKEDRVRSSAELTEEIRRRIPDLAGTTVAFQSMGFESMGTGSDQTPIAIRIFGNDIPALRRFGERALEAIRGVEGVRDPDITLKVSKPELHVRIDREQAARFGLSAAQVGSLLEACVRGTLVTFLRAQGEEVDITVRFREEDRDSVEKILALGIPTPGGPLVRLDQVARFEESTGPLQITRESQRRKVTVTASIHGRAHSLVMEDVRRNLAPLEAELKAEKGGYFIDYGGTYKSMMETFSSLLKALIAAIILVYMIMAAQFESLSHPLVIMATVPLGLIGVVIGLLVMGMNFSTPAFIGLVILMGIVVNNAIVMVDFINQLRAGGMDLRTAVIRGASMRLRPILITSLTTILGMVPMAISRTSGSEMRGPMGVAIASGLLFGMILTLFIIPCAYIVMVGIAARMVAIASRLLYGSEEG